MESYLNQELSPKERAEDLLGKLSIEEKMAQVNCLFPFQGNWNEIKHEIDYGIGQISTLDVRAIRTLEEVAKWQIDLQEKVMKSSPHSIPAIFHMEGLGGAFIQDSTSFPTGIARGASWDNELEEEIGKIVSRQELACGITQVLAPVLDISRDSRMGRQSETYGEDPTLAAAMGTAYTRGVQGNEVAERKAESVAKHFLGSQNSQGGIHGANCDIPDRLLYEVYGKPFQAAIKEADLRGIMPCYSSVNGEPLSTSKKILTDILRDEMGFDGICVADYSAIANVHSTQKVAESYAEAGLLSMEAGMDIEMQNRVCFNDELKEWFESGKADISILNRAVLRVLETKFRMGLFENPFSLEGNELKEVFSNKKDKEITLKSALESMVLLKNNGVLPIEKSVKSIAIIGCHAKNARAFFGGYTHLSMVEAIYAVANSIAGITTGSVEGKTEETSPIKTIPGTKIQSDETEEFDSILKLQKPECKSLLETIMEKYKNIDVTYAYGYPIAGNDFSHIEEAIEIAKKADIVIMTLGGKNGSCSVASMGEGVDGTNINLPECQDEFIRRASQIGKPLIGIHFDGRPISSDVADEYLDAIIEAWNPSEMGGEAITKILFGEYNPGGKLPVTVARNAGQTPIYYNHQNGSYWHQGESIGFKDYVDCPHTPRYYFGHGLSYSNFLYSDISISKNEIGPEGAVEIQFKIKNISEVDGDEVVQIYLKDIFASVTRNVKELAGFKRIHLKAGEEKTLQFALPASQTAFLDRDMKWKIEKGEFELQIGSSSEDIRLKEKFWISEDGFIEGKNRNFYLTI